MDEIAYALKQQEEEDNEDALEQELEQSAALAAVALMVVGAEESHRLRTERRQSRRLYLCQPQLLPNPHKDTPWQVLYQSHSDRAFITTMGFDVDAFEHLIKSGFARMWYERPIDRSDTMTAGNPRPSVRSLDAWGALGLVLHYLNSTMREISLQQIFALIPATISRYITFALPLLFETLDNIPESFIKYPKLLHEFQENSDLIVSRHPRLHGAFASLDGLNLAVQTSEDVDIENAAYNGWLSEHFVSSVLMYSPKGALQLLKIFFKLNLLC